MTYEQHVNQGHPEKFGACSRCSCVTLFTPAAPVTVQVEVQGFVSEPKPVSLTARHAGNILDVLLAERGRVLDMRRHSDSSGDTLGVQIADARLTHLNADIDALSDAITIANFKAGKVDPPHPACVEACAKVADEIAKGWENLNTPGGERGVYQSAAWTVAEALRMRGAKGAK